MLVGVLADIDGWSHMGGWNWGWMVIMGLFWITALGLIAWAVTRSSGSPAAPSPLEVLDHRFARGEITPEEYEQRRAILGG